jgi:gluconate 5-dehydrogenase
VAGISRGEFDCEHDRSDRLLKVLADVADPSSVASAFESIQRKFGGVDVLFNNAAVYSKVNFLEESPEDWMRDVAINLGGVSNCCKAVLPIMIGAGHGRIYNVGSFADYAPIEKSSAYSTSKGGLHALTRSVAVDIAHLGLDIQVHEWVPGHLNTQMSDFTGIDPAVSAAWALGIVEADAASAPCVVYENDRELVLTRSLKQRLLAKLAFWK